jgi:hypothetical protein
VVIGASWGVGSVWVLGRSGRAMVVGDMLRVWLWLGVVVTGVVSRQRFIVVV